MESESKLEEIRRTLSDRPGIVVVSDVTDEPRFDGRKYKEYTDTRIAVAPVREVMDVQGLTTVVLSGVENVTLHNSQLRAHDRIGENRYSTIAVQVFPSAEAALQAQEKSQ